ncbi:dihydrolipoyl dehydrogenase family protein [Arthrobacter sp. U41]|uniref:dihydrolipoyl dehydrogenase family protein n=1 Tax=Arthrobacter sp. U41 TaxID=1849032 RepID=UPI0008594DFA|nr:NAD(P)/FAD-dependent oxidoreductase [Arthrobacter sp. U41]AOT03267.1 pyridine nucleotide-disulfide oxidoreductase [Arthrobacter sp. U41]
MEEHFDVAVLGMGPGGEVAASRLLKAHKKVAVIERELIGGECAYWACVPSKTLLRPPEAKTAAARSAGVTGAELDWAAASDYRDYMIRHLDDKAQIDGYKGQGATVIKAEARITGPGTLQAGGRTIHADHIIIATGSEAVMPELEGAENVTIWTNRETFTTTTLPRRAVVIGGSAVGTETATFLARFGVDVTLVHRGKALMEREEPRVGELTRLYLEEAGVNVRLASHAVRARREGDSSSLELDDGTSVGTDVVIFATGRRPRSKDLGFEAAGVKLDPKGAVVIDEQCRAGEGVWAGGDVTAVMPFTHVAKYQGRIVADAILGHARPATYDGIPRVVFGDPEIAAAGITQAQADEQGLSTAFAELDLAESLTRPWTYEQEPRGHLGLLTDTNTGTLIGAWAVSPLAGEWIHQASLAIRARIPLAVLHDQVAQFPSYSEAFHMALDNLKYRKELL